MVFSSQPFKRSEFGCGCGCGFNTVDTELLGILEDLRYWADAPITINSGCRCAAHNYVIGGKTHSKHVVGKAADIVTQGKTPTEVYAYLCDKYKHSFGFIKYDTFVHVDSRTTKYRSSKCQH